MNEFSRSRRLLKKTDYDHVFEHAKKMASPHFTFLYRDNSLGHARLGLALSKKMIAKAHDRSRIKRLIRETFRVHQHLASIDVIVLAKPRLAHIQNTELRQDLEALWFKLSK
ncbi:MAG TPA: ribonuclease P protein component [Legionellaceae bacterium]|nr:ribonuclease P protein component [Legionellaceae bacterium]